MYARKVNAWFEREPYWYIIISGLILPGSRKDWPQEITINSTPSLVVEKEGYPAVFTKSPGNYLVEGKTLCVVTGLRQTCNKDER